MSKRKRRQERPYLSKPGQRIQNSIYAWFDRRYPDVRAWFGPASAEYAPASIEVRAVIALDAIEYNISNGGWSQLLWNCLPAWRLILDDGQHAYSQMGAMEQAAELRRIHDLCLRDEAQCGRLTAIHDPEMENFARFTSRSAAGECREHLYYDSSYKLYALRLLWMSRERTRIAAALRAAGI
jgi:hypothetical protein